MNKYTVYLKNNKKIKVIADDWSPVGNFLVFNKDSINICWVPFTELLALKKETIR